MAPRIPQELWDLVIDNCRGDTHTLRDLTLVCQAWLVRALEHLFRSVRLFSPIPVQYHKNHKTTSDSSAVCCEMVRTRP